MIKHLLAGIIALLWVGKSFGCDVCGCGAGTFSSSWLATFNAHTIGVGYSQTSFATTHPSISDFSPTTMSFERFETLDLRGQLFPHRNIQLSFVAPVHRFSQSAPESNETLSGFGDAQVMAHGVFNLGSNTGSVIFQRFMIGGGIKLPTGKNQRVGTDGELINPYLQLGTGSFDVPLNLVYLFKAANWAASADYSYRFNTSNRQHFRFGNRSQFGITAMRWMEFNPDVWIRPSVSARLETLEQDQPDSRYAKLNPESGGRLASIELALPARLNRFVLNPSCRIPIWQDLAEGMISASTALQFEIQYIIPTKN